MPSEDTTSQLISVAPGSTSAEKVTVTSKDIAGTDPQKVAAEAADRARREEKERQRKEIERVQKERDDFEARLKAKEVEEHKAKLAAMQPDERVQTQLQDLQRQIQERDQKSVKEVNALKRQLRAAELTAYRELVLRKYGDEIISDMVVGNSEEEIDQMAEAAANAYRNIYAKARHEFEAKLPQEFQPQMVPVPVVQAPPPNPAYVHPSYAAPGAFPMATNAEPVAQADPGQVDLSNLTTEEAVRTGRYSGEMRARLLDQVKRMPGSQNLGSAPRYYGQQASPPGYTMLPGGVMQPQGTPMGPVMHPQMMQPGFNAPSQPQQQMVMPIPAVQGPMPTQQFNQAAQYAPAPSQPQGLSPADAARAAVARTHAGQGVSPIATQISAESAAFGAKNGVSSQMAFAQRFSNTPPVSGDA